MADKLSETNSTKSNPSSSTDNSSQTSSEQDKISKTSSSSNTPSTNPKTNSQNSNKKGKQNRKNRKKQSMQKKQSAKQNKNPNESKANPKASQNSSNSKDNPTEIVDTVSAVSKDVPQDLTEVSTELVSSKLETTDDSSKEPSNSSDNKEEKGLDDSFATESFDGTTKDLTEVSAELVSSKLETVEDSSKVSADTTANQKTKTPEKSPAFQDSVQNPETEKKAKQQKQVANSKGNSNQTSNKRIEKGQQEVSTTPAQEEERQALEEIKERKRQREQREKDGYQKKSSSSANEQIPVHSEEESDSTETEPAGRRSWLILVASVLVLTFLGVYLFGAIYYQSHFFPNTTLLEYNLDNLTLEEAEIYSYTPLQTTLTITGRDDTSAQIVLSGEEALRVVDSQDLSALMKGQKNWLWFTELSQEHPYDVAYDVQIDEAKFSPILEDAVLQLGESVTQPQDARLEWTENGYDLVEEIQGNALDEEQFRSVVIEAVGLQQSTLDLTVSSPYLAPELTADNPVFSQAIEAIESSKEMTLTLDFSEGRTEPLGYDIFSQWVDTTLLGQGEIVFDEQAVKDYVATLAEENNTLNTTRQFSSTLRGMVEVKPGVYGWNMNQGATSTKIIEALKQGESATIPVQFWSTARSWGEDDIGDTYVEIDISNQHMWFYKDGELMVDTGVVTGLPTAERATPKGAFVIWAKETKRYLEGDDYKLWVEFWMPIDWTGVGIHDASWQYSFGGENYLVRGSHGCINTPYAKCAVIFENADVGTPVMVY